MLDAAAAILAWELEDLREVNAHSHANVLLAETLANNSADFGLDEGAKALANNWLVTMQAIRGRHENRGYMTQDDIELRRNTRRNLLALIPNTQVRQDLHSCF